MDSALLLICRIAYLHPEVHNPVLLQHRVREVAYIELLQHLDFSLGAFANEQGVLVGSLLLQEDALVVWDGSTSPSIR